MCALTLDGVILLPSSSVLKVSYDSRIVTPKCLGSLLLWEKDRQFGSSQRLTDPDWWKINMFNLRKKRKEVNGWTTLYFLYFLNMNWHVNSCHWWKALYLIRHLSQGADQIKSNRFVHEWPLVEFSKSLLGTSWDQWLQNLRCKKLYTILISQKVSKCYQHSWCPVPRCFSPLAATFMTVKAHCYMLSWGSSGAPVCVDGSRMVPFLENNPVCPAVSGPIILSWMPKEGQTSAACQIFAQVLPEPFACHFLFHL